MAQVSLLFQAIIWSHVTRENNLHGSPVRTLNFIWRWGSNTKTLGSIECTLIDIISGSTFSYRGNICGPNRSLCKLFVFVMNTWYYLKVYKISLETITQICKYIQRMKNFLTCMYKITLDRLGWHAVKTCRWIWNQSLMNLSYFNVVDLFHI